MSTDVVVTDDFDVYTKNENVAFKNTRLRPLWILSAFHDFNHAPNLILFFFNAR